MSGLSFFFFIEEKFSTAKSGAGEAGNCRGRLASPAGASRGRSGGQQAR
jgi:hypothetical protein